DRNADVFRFLLFAVLLAPVIGATIGTASLCFDDPSKWSNFWMLWFTWWVGDASGILIVAPLGLTLRQAFRKHWRLAELSELTVLLVTFSALSAYIFCQDQRFRVAFPVVPLLAWGAIRFRQPSVAIMTFLM